MEEDKKQEEPIDILEIEEEVSEGAIPKTETPTLKLKQSKSLKIFGIIIAIAMVIIASLFLYMMWTKAFYIQNHACEVCVMEEDAVCHINEQLYFKDGDTLNVRNDVIPYYAMQEQEPINTIPTEEEVDEMFSGIIK